jgi:hypothetical protein
MSATSDARSCFGPSHCAAEAHTRCSICSRPFCRQHVALLDDGALCLECFLSDFEEDGRLRA